MQYTRLGRPKGLPRTRILFGCLVTIGSTYAEWMSDTATPTTSSPDPGPDSEVAADANGAVDVDVPILTVSDAALEKVLEIRDAEDDAESTGLRVVIVGTAGVEYDYDLSLESLDDVADDAITYEDLRGSTLDLPSNPMQGGLVIRNPNRPPVLAPEDVELTGTLAEKVQQLLDLAINPALASHGGFASLVKVEDDSIVHVLMGGGCQGCSLSAQTLTEGM